MTINSTLVLAELASAMWFWCIVVLTEFITVFVFLHGWCCKHLTGVEIEELVDTK